MNRLFASNHSQFWQAEKRFRYSINKHVTGNLLNAPEKVNVLVYSKTKGLLKIINEDAPE